MSFTDVDCEQEYDTVTITDKDGTRLGLFDGKYDSDDDWQTKEIVSNSDMVEVLFHSDGSSNRKGWRLNWGELSMTSHWQFSMARCVPFLLVGCLLGIGNTQLFKAAQRIKESHALFTRTSSVINCI